LLQIAFALLVAALLAWLFSRYMYVGIAIAVAAPAFATLAARAIIDLVAATNYAGKAAALADVQGRYWSYHGYRIGIAEDYEHARWLLAADVRKIVKNLPRDDVLLKQFGERAGPVEDFEGFCIRADALAEYLQKATDPPTLRFRMWLDRTVRGGSVNPRANRLGA
jgi:hypothetical protein